MTTYKILFRVSGMETTREISGITDYVESRVIAEALAAARYVEAVNLIKDDPDEGISSNTMLKGIMTIGASLVNSLVKGES